MKRTKINLKPFIVIGVLALTLVSCFEFEEFESTNMGAAPTITLAEVSVQDSSITVSVTSSADGYASVILLPGSGNAVPEDAEDLLTNNVASLEFQSKKVSGSTAAEFTFSGLIQYAVYEVMAAANNGNGKISTVATLVVGTEDSHAPVLSATDPGITYSPVLAPDGPVYLVFDEPVLYDDSKDLTFSTWYGGADILASAVEVDGNVVTVTPAEAFGYRDYVWLSYPAGAFTDHAGNEVEEMVTYLDGSSFVGLYWRVEAFTYEPESVSPAAGAVADPAFTVVLTFADVVDADDVADGDITFTYVETVAGGTVTYDLAVPSSDVSAAGNDLTIVPPMVPVSGTEVTITIPEGLLGIGYGNPNAEFTETWTIE
ncbi:MAG: hypothetical protein R2751_08400 [Bacteroidales bacterium]